MALFVKETQSQKIFRRSQEVIPGGVNSPVRSFAHMGVDPIIAASGRGDSFWDIDGKEWIDFCMSWGALLHGHAHPTIVERSSRRMAEGSSFGLATEVEERLARTITEAMPSIEQVRFVSSGTEATLSAVRLARGFTQRPFIIKFNGNYHGHGDGFLVKAGSGAATVPSSEGVPMEVIQKTLPLPYNDGRYLKRVLSDPLYVDKVAAVIVEPIAANMGVIPATLDFLRIAREETERMGALLVFDEVITGFRVGYGGAQAHYGITPDLTCLGKVVGGGFPAAAFGGRREIMQRLAPIGSVYQAGTLSGNPVAMEGGLASLELAQREGFYEELKAKGEVITRPVKELLKKKKLSACLQESVGLFTLFWGIKEARSFEDLERLDHEWFKRYFCFLWERGIYIPPSPYEACFLSSAHTQTHLETMRDATLEFILG